MKRLLFEENTLLKNFSTFKVGGPARYFTTVTTSEELKNAFAFAKEHSLPPFILGKGSNCLFDEKGINGLVILNKIDHFSLEGEKVDVGSGYMFSLLGIKTAMKGLSGLEFASGIPGTVGGAVYMNAGANGRETCDFLTQVTFMDLDGQIQTYPKNALAFSYRSSSFHLLNGAILSAQFSLQTDPKARERQISIAKYRIETQPYKQPSAGCVFQNPVGEAAGSIIERCGLKGKRVGDAEVSSLHGNFIVNHGSATAQDILTLAKEVRQNVKTLSGIDLVLEMRVIPYEL